MRVVDANEHGKLDRGSEHDPVVALLKPERRTERQLIADYCERLDEIIARLSRETHDVAIKLAEIPEQIRGFGHVKTRHLEEAKRTEAVLLAKLRNQPAPATQAAE